MFSYRHAYHAGSHADLLKHLTLCSLLAALQRKDTGLALIDTHAGCGLYSLHSAPSQRSGEAQTGVLRLLAALKSATGQAGRDIPVAVKRYRQQLTALAATTELSASGQLRHYPGSPALMWQALRAQDTLHCFELLAVDARALQRQLQHCYQTEIHAQQATPPAVVRKKWQVHISNGFEGLRALLPPPSRRGLVLIDPSYEIKTDYAAVVGMMRDALQRFATGCYAIWLPEVPLMEAHTLPRKLRTLATQHSKSYIRATLRLPLDPNAAAGKLRGSSLCIINPPFTLAQELKEALPFLAQALGHAHLAAGQGWELELVLV